VEHRGELIDEVILDFSDCHGPANLLGERRHTSIGDSARHDQIEEVDVGGDVEGEAVARDPTRDADTNRADLRFGCRP
jgi:hypothetical protein